MDDYVKLFMIFLLIVASVVLLVRNSTLPYIITSFILLTVSNFLVLYAV